MYERNGFMSTLKKSIAYLLCICMMFTLLPCIAMATDDTTETTTSDPTIFYDSFDGYETGASIKSGGALATGSRSSDVSLSYTATSATIAENPSATDKSVYIVKDSDSNARPQVNFGNTTPIAEDKVVVSFSANFDEAPGSTIMQLYTVDKTNSDTKKDTFYPLRYDDGFFRDANSANIEGLTVSTGKWYSIEMVFDFANGSYDMEISDGTTTVVKEDITINSNQAEDYLYVVRLKPTTSWYLNDFYIGSYVEETTTPDDGDDTTTPDDDDETTTPDDDDETTTPDDDETEEDTKDNPNTVFYDDFESYELGKITTTSGQIGSRTQTMSFTASAGAVIIANPDDSEDNVVKLENVYNSNNTNNRMQINYGVGTPITEDKVVVSFDTYFETLPASDFTFVTIGTVSESDSSARQEVYPLKVDIDTMKFTDANNSEITSVSAKKWYSVKMSFDFSTLTYDIEINDGTNTAELTEITMSKSKDSLWLVRTNISNSTSAYYLDDFYVYVIPAVKEPDVIYETYSSETDFESGFTAGEDGFTLSTGAAVETDPAGGSGNALHISAADGATASFTSEFTELYGEVKLELDIYKAENSADETSAVYAGDENGYNTSSFVTLTADGKVMAGENEIGSFTLGEWTKIGLVINPAAKTYEVYINGLPCDGVYTYTTASQSNYISNVKIEASADDFYIDNYSIKQLDLYKR